MLVQVKARPFLHVYLAETGTEVDARDVQCACCSARLGLISRLTDQLVSNNANSVRVEAGFDRNNRVCRARVNRRRARPCEKSECSQVHGLPQPLPPSPWCRLVGTRTDVAVYGTVY